MPIFIQKHHRRRVSQRLLRRAIEETLNSEGIRLRSVEVSIALVDDAEIQALNAQYRKKDKPTDVLSFPQGDDTIFPGSPQLLGDVVISLDTAVTQAAAAGRSLDDEVCQLAIHGILHLLGYDDVTPEGYAEMVHKGNAVWERVERARTDHSNNNDTASL